VTQTLSGMQKILSLMKDLPAITTAINAPLTLCFLLLCCFLHLPSLILGHSAGVLRLAVCRRRATLPDKWQCEGGAELSLIRAQCANDFDTAWRLAAKRSSRLSTFLLLHTSKAVDSAKLQCAALHCHAAGEKAVQIRA
jgi:hypothetical protein